jgi:UTP--glucose-1-phosphate uridylyltransferase
VEKPKSDPPSDMAVMGRYIFTPEIFPCLEHINEGVKGEIQLTETIKDLLEKQPVYRKIISGDRYDIGILKEYIELMKIIVIKTNP